MDGVGGLTQKPVLPGETFEYRFVPPDAGLYWYHPHVWPDGAAQKDRGLYGVLIVDEVEPPTVDADRLIVLDDWTLDARAQVRVDSPDDGRPGALVTVNGKLVPALETVVPGARVRFRLLNACSARICVIGFVNLKPMVVAIDGQPSELFAPMRGMVPIGPGSRFEIIADLPAESGATASLVLHGDGEPDIPLMSLATRGKPVPARPATAKLPPNPLLPTQIHLERSLRKDFVIGGAAPASGHGSRPVVPAPGAKSAADAPAVARPWSWTVNGVASDGLSGKPLFTQKRGGAVTLSIVNKTAVVQQIHVHGHVWRLLHDLDDGWDPYWRDSVLLAPGKTKHVAFIADNPGKWAIVSSILDRQETGLAAWFEVI
jgi:FtsP/CotA-like multicopper oxidase with cupredoxin domain